MNEKTLSIFIRDFLGILALAFTVFAVLSLVTYSPADPSIHNAVAGKTEVKNLGGLVGAYLSDTLVQTFGTCAFFFPIITLIAGWALIRGKAFVHWPLIFLSGVLFIGSLCALLAVLLDTDPYFGKRVQTGGYAGTVLGYYSQAWLNKTGAILTLSTLVFMSLLAMTRTPVNVLVDLFKGAVGAVFEWIGEWAAGVMERIGEWFGEVRAERAERAEQRAEEKKNARPKKEPVIVTHTPPEPEASAALVETKPKKKKQPPKIIETPFTEEEFVVEEDEEEEEETGDYQVPPLSLLADPPEKMDSEELREEILHNSSVLEQKLADFGIEGRVVQVLPGPVITLFEFELAPGIKVSRIMSLSDDLALAMRAMSIRILAPVPGKSVVGIEIPNTKKETVYFKEIMCSAAFHESDSPLTLAIGKDNIGQPMVQDLATVPHLLMAGSTGSGKSVGLNSMICSILLNASPDEVKMIMVDPKMLELSIYDGIPHLIAPVVTNPKKAAAALQWAVTEMENRYKMMAKAGVRNIKGYNEYVESLWEEEDEEEEDEEEELEEEAYEDEEGEEEEDGDEEEAELPEKLPYIVVLIDELADLMMVASKGVEESLTRLAQMARAAGIHLIVATQRPSVDVLTGIIKANFPARISYKVTSRVDSRTILDSMGADRLLGKGDMLFLAPGTSKLMRIHGAMVSDAEINRIVSAIKQQKKPDYQEEIFDAVQAEGKSEDENEEFDEKYDEAVAIVAKDRQASISYIQRRLRIGYNRAARIIETMEKEGVVGPSDGVKPREIYVKPILLEE